MTENWRKLIQDRHENGMMKAASLLPIIKKELELPKPTIIEPQNLNTEATIKQEIIKINKIQEINVKETNIIKENIVGGEIEDQAEDLKSEYNEENIDLSKLTSSVGAHKTHGLKLSWIENKNKNKDDFHTIEWGKESNTSFVTGKIQFPVPMFWDSDGHKIHLEDNAKGSSVILIGNKCKISYDKCHCIAVDNELNSQIKIILKFDSVNIRTLKSPIIKIMPLEYARILRPDGIFNFHSPFTYYFMRNNKYQNDNFWYEDCFFSNDSMAYNNLITSLRILFVMGYRTVYLDGFETTSNDFAIYDDIIKNSVNKIKIFNIGNNDIRGINRFDRSSAIASCIL
jgi:hypothetical protein